MQLVYSKGYCKIASISHAEKPECIDWQFELGKSDSICVKKA